MIGEAKIPDTTSLSLFDQKVKHSVVQIPPFESIHSTHADAVKQHIVNVVNLKVCK